ncbi:DNA polymerase III subunits gamma and tau [Bifidobacterium reuteri DSM 23975]|uniref:DNA-directed DNA polymerase n=1 Tax=Bifidobacterium reuteri DSM 23975 TaxID=1437610 RepID=A0A087CP85_9BIFI|nr:DNA polymerase III subunit gamma and tau [Bifidobacterium reuteri]KFI85085.1 DNA polymerase III subunits gamma and tau [Bifidobacterium reuteri DSM 23975]
MALALYRRYRPDTFEGVIGQDQVTVPLMRALDEGKLTHAYLFSGPRGCGKTSSARILARCVNCAKGPTSHPCGECESCKDLATGGPGSIDVVEIDAASHNGVDDARELRERAGFAPARDRYKIFILDEAHMVTQQGFNALLKIVEEPPEHVMFIFATTEPDKVIGTIRSRTHHYPFRLVPQEVMGPYLEKICAKEGIKPEPGVLKLAMRAGGGSMRDTLSVLDQLMVGSVEGVITHDAAVALLGFTPEALIGEAVDAVIDRNGEACMGVIQKVVVGGFDPRRFVEDLLARVRDLLVLTLAGDSAESVLSDTAEAEDMSDLHRQASALGLGPLTVMADIINDTLSAMTGAISPRMRLELLAARLLAGAETGFAFTASAAPSAGAPAQNGGEPATGGNAGAAGARHHAGSGGFAGASRNAGAGSAPGGFAGASGASGGSGASGTSAVSQGGFSGAARNQQVQQAPAASIQSAPVQSAPAQSAQVQSETTQPAAQGWVYERSAAPSAGEPTGWGQPVQTSAPAQQPAQPAMQEPANTTAPAGATAAAPANDTRSVDEKWNAAVNALPEDIREYVTRAKVPSVRFGQNRKGLPCLSLTFDQSLSQHAFALAVDSSGKKAAIVVQDAVRKEFGPNTVIAPTQVAANGERVESVKRMSPEQLAKVKQQIALAKAGLAAASLGSGLGAHLGSDSKEQKPAASGQGEDADDSHRGASQSADQAAGRVAALPTSDASRASVSSAAAMAPGTSPASAMSVASQQSAGQPGHLGGNTLPDDDPWAHPASSPTAVASGDPTTSSAPAHPEHHKKHVPVPDISDGIDPWSQPSPAATAENDPWNQPAQPQSAQVLPPAQPIPAQSATQPDPWNQPAPAQLATAEPDPWNQPAPSNLQTTQQPVPPDDDPWNQPPQQQHAASGWEQSQAPQQGYPPHASAGAGLPQTAAANAGLRNDGPSDDPWNQPPQQSTPAPEPRVDPDDDEYSMNDQSLGDSRAMSLDDLKKMFEVKDVKEFAADDPKNPKNIQPAKKHLGE